MKLGFLPFKEQLGGVAVLESFRLVEDFAKSLEGFIGDYQFLRITPVPWKFRIDELDV